jgi:hypothetical protein
MMAVQRSFSGPTTGRLFSVSYAQPYNAAAICASTHLPVGKRDNNNAYSRQARDRSFKAARGVNTPKFSDADASMPVGYRPLLATEAITKAPVENLGGNTEVCCGKVDPRAWRPVADIKHQCSPTMGEMKISYNLHVHGTTVASSACHM